MSEIAQPAVSPRTGRQDERLSAAGGIPIGPCPSCEREVVAYALDDAAEPLAEDRWACVHCDGPIRRVEWIDEGELDNLGYSVHDPLRGGCATGCAAGGCAARPSRPE